MKLWRSISSRYGQFRGYGRLEIRHSADAAGRTTPQELSLKSMELFRFRVLDAVGRFPAYSKLIEKRFGELPGSPENIQPHSLPVLSKEDIRSILASPGNTPLENTIPQATGGSTGRPLRFLITRRSFEWSTAVSDRGYSWAGAEEGRRSFYIWGAPIVAPSKLHKIKAGFHHRLQNRRFFNSFRFGDTDKEECCRLINRFRPESIVGYAGNIVELARFVEQHPEHLRWRAATAIAAAEAPRPGAREMIETHVADELFLSYGSREFMLIGMECREHNGYHISSDNLYVEVVDDYGRPLAPGETGRIVITDLHNDATPFIRYEIGDLGSMGGMCPCGLPFPILSSVDGRIEEVVILRNGDKLTALFIPHLMKEFDWIDGYQVHQTRPGEITVKLITPREDWLEGTKIIESHLRNRLGDGLGIGFERVDTLQKTASGKTLIVISELKQECG